MMNRVDPVWFITGCSTGFGRELAKLVLQKGWRAVVTARNPSQVADIAKGHADRALVLPLDVTRRDQIDAAVDQALKRFGRIDALVNNAGYGYLAAIEEGEDAAVRAMFETNVFGLIDMTKAVLPIMRAQAQWIGRQCLVDRRSHELCRDRLLPRHEVRRRRNLGIVGRRIEAAGHRRAHRRTGPVSHELGRTLDPAVCHSDRCLCGNCRRAPKADRSAQRSSRRETRCGQLRQSSMPRFPIRRPCACFWGRRRWNWPARRSISCAGISILGKRQRSVPTIRKEHLDHLTAAR